MIGSSLWSLSLQKTREMGFWYIGADFSVTLRNGVSEIRKPQNIKLLFLGIERSQLQRFGVVPRMAQKRLLRQTLLGTPCDKSAQRLSKDQVMR